MSLRTRADDLTELMDDPDCDAERLTRTLRRLAIVNRAVAAWGRVYRTLLRPAFVGLGRPVRILDVGCGGGDVLRRVVGLARRDGLDIAGVGIDPEPHAFAVARAATPMPGVTYRQAVSGDLVAAGDAFDVVLSNHLLHHLDREQFDGLLADSTILATTLSAHSDIARSRAAYAAFSAAAAPLAPGSFVRVDGLRSIRRSYTRRELSMRLPAGWHVHAPAPYRLLALHDASGRLT